MTTEHLPVPVSPLQLKLKDFCVWIETKFECRIDRFAFALRMALAAAVFYAIFHAQTNWLADARWPLWALSRLLFGWAAFWVILQMVRRFHDMGRTGSLFWAVSIPYWAAGKLIGMFPDLWFVWVALCAYPIWLTLQLFVRSGTDGISRFERRTAPAV